MQPNKKFVKTYKLTELFEDKNEFSLFCNSLNELLLIFKEKFVQRKLDYFFKTGTKEPQKKLSLCVPKESIMHLFGINYYAYEERNNDKDYQQPSFAKEFFLDFENNKLDYSKCWVESLSKVKDKMCVLKYIEDIKTEKVRVGEYGLLRKIPLTNTLSTPKTFLGLGLHHDNSEFSVPRTCLNLQNDKEAKDNKSFKKVYKCSKIIEHERLPNGKWKTIRRENFTKQIQEDKIYKKRKKSKKKKNI